MTLRRLAVSSPPGRFNSPVARGDEVMTPHEIIMTMSWLFLFFFAFFFLLVWVIRRWGAERRLSDYFGPKDWAIRCPGCDHRWTQKRDIDGGKTLGSFLFGPFKPECPGCGRRINGQRYGRAVPVAKKIAPPDGPNLGSLR
jgi:hypothetical protein